MERAIRTHYLSELEIAPQLTRDQISSLLALKYRAAAGCRENPTLVELALRSALDAVPKDCCISVVAEFLRSQGMLVRGDIPPSTMSVT